MPFESDVIAFVTYNHQHHRLAIIDRVVMPPTIRGDPVSELVQQGSA